MRLLSSLSNYRDNSLGNNRDSSLNHNSRVNKNPNKLLLRLLRNLLPKRRLLKKRLIIWKEVSKDIKRGFIMDINDWMEIS